MVEHDPHCDADLRDNGCVCVDAEDRLRQLAADWADMVAKREREETDRLARQAFA